MMPPDADLVAMMAISMAVRTCAIPTIAACECVTVFIAHAALIVRPGLTTRLAPIVDGGLVLPLVVLPARLVGI